MLRSFIFVAGVALAIAGTGHRRGHNSNHSHLTVEIPKPAGQPPSPVRGFPFAKVPLPDLTKHDLTDHTLPDGMPSVWMGRRGSRFPFSRSGSFGFAWDIDQVEFTGEFFNELLVDNPLTSPKEKNYMLEPNVGSFGSFTGSFRRITSGSFNRGTAGDSNRVTSGSFNRVTSGGSNRVAYMDQWAKMNFPTEQSTANALGTLQQLTPSDLGEGYLAAPAVFRRMLKTGEEKNNLAFRRAFHLARMQSTVIQDLSLYYVVPEIWTDDAGLYLVEYPTGTFITKCTYKEFLDFRKRLLENSDVFKSYTPSVKSYITDMNSPAEVESADELTRSIASLIQYGIISIETEPTAPLTEKIEKVEHALRDAFREFGEGQVSETTVSRL